MDARTAEACARHFHRNQSYNGQPYVDAHVAPVVARVIAEGGSQDAIVVAWLHDVLEDCDVDLPADNHPLVTLTRAQAVALAAITRKPGEEYPSYVQRAVREPVARLVKYCDLLQNLSCQPPEHLRRRYLAALDLVRSVLDNDHQLPRRSMMRASAAAAAEIDQYFRFAGNAAGSSDGWPSGVGKHWERADAVLQWCASKGDWPLATEVTTTRLAAAMQRMPYWMQGPANYFDVARALSAAVLVGLVS